MRNLPLHSPSNGGRARRNKKKKNSGLHALSSHRPPPPPLPLPAPRAPYFLKVSVWEINDPSAAKDDSLHKDDIELISEMLRHWLFDVYRQTWIIKILLKNPWMADTRILFVMINLAQSLQWESSWSVSDKIAFYSPHWISHCYFSSFSFPCSANNSWSDWTWCVSASRTNTEDVAHPFISLALRLRFAEGLFFFLPLFYIGGFFYVYFHDGNFRAAGTPLHSIFSMSLACQLFEGCLVTLAFNAKMTCSKTLLWCIGSLMGEKRKLAFNELRRHSLHLLSAINRKKLFELPSLIRRKTTACRS